MDSETKLLITGSADNTMRLWDVQTGKELFQWRFDTAVRSVSWSSDDKQVLMFTDARVSIPAVIRVYDINREDPTKQSTEPVRSIELHGLKVKPNQAMWAALDEAIITAHDDGTVARLQHDRQAPESGMFDDLVELRVQPHPGSPITDLQMSPDSTYFLTSSRDKSAKLLDARTLETIKTYATETPLNSAAVHPTRPFVIVGGGQDAMAVTTTSASEGHFETRFWHKVFEEECGRFPGHFGPVNTIAIHPFGKCYATGGEDGYVRVNWFDPSFFTQKLYGNEFELAPEDQ